MSRRLDMRGWNPGGQKREGLPTCEDTPARLCAPVVGPQTQPSVVYDLSPHPQLPADAMLECPLTRRFNQWRRAASSYCPRGALSDVGPGRSGCELP